MMDYGFVLKFLLLQGNVMTRKQVSEERVYLTYTSTSLFIIERSQGRNSNNTATWKQQLTQRIWGCCILACSPILLSLLFYRTQDHQPRKDPTHDGVGLPYQSLIKKIPYSWILWRHFLD